jgi:hypothetical protein
VSTMRRPRENQKMPTKAAVSNTRGSGRCMARSDGSA